ncbi:MAG: hypothetical protein K2M13_08470 [Muribaculaceae bacterium]|nr:hypothetical protein [Muribaculaceae bacterium]
MTPNHNSPRFLRHEVPAYACENSKKLSQLFIRLREQIANNKWEGITENDIDLTYNTYNEFTEVNIKFRDDNKHLHHFSICLLPYNGWGNVEDDSFHLSYYFDGTFNENVLFVRSFAGYIATYLGYEGFELTMVNCDKGIWLESSMKYAFEDFCKLIDITISCLRPLEWFYSKEPKITTYEEASIYLEGVMSRLQIEVANNRWEGVKPECFKLVKFVAEREASLGLVYIVKDVWELHLSIDLADCGEYFDMFGTFRCYPDINLPPYIKSQLNALFANFLSTLNVAKGHTFIGCGNTRDSSISIQYFYIEDTFEIFCNMLDEIVPAIHKYEFQLALPFHTLTEKIRAIKKQLEAKLHAIFDVITEEQTINKKLEHGYFKSYN